MTIGRTSGSAGDDWFFSLESGDLEAAYKVDCKYHTYNELWIYPDVVGHMLRGSPEDERAYLPVEWDAIKPDSEPALIEARFCRPRRAAR